MASDFWHLTFHFWYSTFHAFNAGYALDGVDEAGPLFKNVSGGHDFVLYGQHDDAPNSFHPFDDAIRDAVSAPQRSLTRVNRKTIPFFVKGIQRNFRIKSSNSFFSEKKHGDL